MSTTRTVASVVAVAALLTILLSFGSDLFTIVLGLMG